jgi:ABC-type transport system substrate-binding protein
LRPTSCPPFALDFCKIIAKHWGESDIDHQKWENALGSGPFKPGKFAKDVSIELVKNKDYWKPGVPRVDGMVHYAIKDKGTATAAYKTGRVLETNWPVTNLSNTEAVQLQKEAEDVLRVEYVRNAIIFFFYMNTSKPPFDNPKVRQAVNLAIDRQAMLNTFGVPGLDSLGPPLGVGTWFGRTAEEIAQLPGWRQLNGVKHPDDIAKATALLAEAGHPDGFQAEMMVRQAVEFPDQAVVYKEQLKKVGIEVTIKLEESATGFQRYMRGDWAMAVQASGNFVLAPDAILGKNWMPKGNFARYARSVPPQWWQDAYMQQAGERDQGHPAQDGGFPDPRGPRRLRGGLLVGQKLDLQQQDQGDPCLRLALGRVQARDRLGVAGGVTACNDAATVRGLSSAVRRRLPSAV